MVRGVFVRRADLHVKIYFPALASFIFFRQSRSSSLSSFHVCIRAVQFCRGPAISAALPLADQILCARGPVPLRVASVFSSRSPAQTEWSFYVGRVVGFSARQPEQRSLPSCRCRTDVCGAGLQAPYIASGTSGRRRGCACAVSKQSAFLE